MTVRYLSPSEARNIEFEVGPVFVASTVRGPVDYGLLRRALALAVEEFPLLRCRITQDSHGYLLSAAADPAPVLLVRSGGGDAFLAEIHTPVDRERSVLRAVMLDDGAAEHTFLLAIDHSIADGRSGLAVLDRIWCHYTSLVTGHQPSVVRRTDIEQAIDHALEGAFPADELDAFVAGGVSRPPSETGWLHAGSGSGTGLTTVRLATTDLLKVARANGVRLSALLGGVVLAALDPPGDLLTCGLAVDVRAKLAPPRAADALTNCATIILATVPAATDPFALARAVEAQWDQALATGAPEKSILAWPRLDPSTVFADHVVVSNVGTVPSPRLPQGTSLLGYRGLNAPIRGTAVAVFVVTTDAYTSIDLGYDLTFHSGAEIEAAISPMIHAMFGG